MAKRYFYSTYTFHAEACIDYAYTCSMCGKPVSGVIKLPFSYGYRKTAPRREDLALTDAERRDGQAMKRFVKCFFCFIDAFTCLIKKDGSEKTRCQNIFKKVLLVTLRNDL